MQRIGVISDTHGQLRPEAIDALKGVDLIIHAGDSGGEAILSELARIAPLHAVRGNCDFGPLSSLPPDLVVETAAGMFYVLHDLYQLRLDPAAAEMAAVIHGHTHMPDIRHKDGVLYLNPGSAGPIRRGRPITMAVVDIDDQGQVLPSIITLVQ